MTVQHDDGTVTVQARHVEVGDYLTNGCGGVIDVNVHDDNVVLNTEHVRVVVLHPDTLCNLYPADPED